jgi:protein TonB
MRTSSLEVIAVLALSSTILLAPDQSMGSATSCAPEPRPSSPRHPPLAIKLKLLHYVAPDYPALARTARIEGRVTLVVKVTEKGEVQNPQIISAHPLLVSGVLAAVKQWRYQPACLEGVPVAVDYTIEIDFNLHNGVTIS